MTFDKQIFNVPLELVKQGWRRSVDNARRDAWHDLAPVLEHCWQGDRVIGIDGTRIDICRPCVAPVKQALSATPYVYAHEGWGEGLQPTPEMVKVWKWWWISMGNGHTPVTVTFHDDVMVVDGIHGRYLGLHKWFGPVLPPVLP